MGKLKKDIVGREDLLQFVTAFYNKLLADPEISYLFTDIAKIDLKEHLSLIADFWNMVLFGATDYQRNAMIPHLKLHDQSAFNKKHFEIWLGYFRDTIDEMFEGEKTELAKQRAQSVASIMKLKMGLL